MEQHDLTAIYLAQRYRESGAELMVTVELDGAKVVLAGKGKSIIPTSLPLIELAHPASTTFSVGFVEDAGERFEAAARRLVQEGRTFGTVLKKGWALPVLVWSMVEEKSAS